MSSWGTNMSVDLWLSEFKPMPHISYYQDGGWSAHTTGGTQAARGTYSYAVVVSKHLPIDACIFDPCPFGLQEIP